MITTVFYNFNINIDRLKHFSSEILFSAVAYEFLPHTIKKLQELRTGCLKSQRRPLIRTVQDGVYVYMWGYGLKAVGPRELRQAAVDLGFLSSSQHS